MLLMRRRDEADGESKMIGSGRRPGFFESRDARVVFMLVVGTAEEAVAVVEVFLRSFMKTSEYLRTCEKSFVDTVSIPTGSGKAKRRGEP